MKNHTYTITFSSENEYPEDVSSLLIDFLTGRKFKVKSSIVEEKVKYPVGGARNIRGVTIRFGEGQVDKNRVEEIVGYWSAFPYVTRGTKVTHCNFIRNTAQFNVDCSTSASHDIDSRDILETLLTLLEEGTPMRVDGTRCFYHACENVEKIVGVPEKIAGEDR